MRGTLRFRAGAWRLQVKAGGKAHTRTVNAPNSRDGRAVAERELRRLVDEVEALPTRAAGGELTVAQWIDRWVELRAASLAPHSQSTNRTFFDRYIVPELGDRWLSRLNREDVQMFYARLRTQPGAKGKPLSTASVQRIHNTLHSVLEAAVDSGRILRNPARGVEVGTLPDPDPNPPAVEEAVKLLEVAADHPMMHAYVRLAATSGARRGMLCALKWSDFTDTSVTFRRAWSKGPDGWQPVELTKSGAVVRVSLTDATLAVIDDWRQFTTAQHHDAEVEPDWVFTIEPGVPLLPPTATSRFRALRATAGLEHVQLRSLRHFMATEMLAAGEEMFVVSRRLGHRNMQITSRYYARFKAEHDASAAEKLDRVLDVTRRG